MQGRFYFRPGEGERIETELRPEGEPPSLLATVLSESGEPVSGAAAILFRAGGGPPQPVSCAVTDEDGQLFFGPLKAGELYLVKLFKAGGAVRQLEIAGD